MHKKKENLERPLWGLAKKILQDQITLILKAFSDSFALYARPKQAKWHFDSEIIGGYLNLPRL